MKLFGLGDKINGVAAVAIVKYNGEWCVRLANGTYVSCLDVEQALTRK